MTRRPQVPPGTRNVGRGSRRNDYIRRPVRVLGAAPARKGCPFAALTLLGWAAAPVAAAVARVRGWV